MKVVNRLECSIFFDPNRSAVKARRFCPGLLCDVSQPTGSLSSHQTCHRRFQQWQRLGLLTTLLQKLAAVGLGRREQVEEEEPVAAPRQAPMPMPAAERLPGRPAPRSAESRPEARQVHIEQLDNPGWQHELQGYPVFDVGGGDHEVDNRSRPRTRA